MALGGLEPRVLLRYWARLVLCKVVTRSIGLQSELKSKAPRLAAS
jgi:hypothetical protein